MSIFSKLTMPRPGAFAPTVQEGAAYGGGLAERVMRAEQEKRELDPEALKFMESGGPYTLGIEDPEALYRGVSAEDELPAYEGPGAPAAVAPSGAPTAPGAPVVPGAPGAPGITSYDKLLRELKAQSVSRKLTLETKQANLEAQAADKAQVRQDARDKQEVEAALVAEANLTRKDEEDKARRQIDAAMDIYSKGEIEPNRIFNNAFSAIASAIGIALGSYAQALQGGGPNIAMQIINKGIDRDIDAQKADLQKNRHMVNLKNNLYARMLKEHGNERQAEILTRKIGLQATQDKLDDITKTYELGDKGGSIVGSIALQVQSESQAEDALLLQNRIAMHASRAASLVDMAKLSGKGGLPMSARRDIARIDSSMVTIKKALALSEKFKETWLPTRLVRGLAIGEFFGDPTAENEFNALMLAGRGPAVRILGEVGNLNQDEQDRTKTMLTHATKSYAVRTSRLEMLIGLGDAAKQAIEDGFSRASIGLAIMGTIDGVTDAGLDNPAAYKAGTRLFKQRLTGQGAVGRGAIDRATSRRF